MSELKQIIEEAFENRDEINFNTKGKIRESVEETLNQLDVGNIRVCEKINNDWVVNQWIKKAILLSFRLNDNQIVKAPHATWYVLQVCYSRQLIRPAGRLYHWTPHLDLLELHPSYPRGPLHGFGHCPALLSHLQVYLQGH